MDILDNLRALEDLAYFPLTYPDIEKYASDQSATFWVPEEINFSEDRDDWDRLDNNSKKYIKMILFLFAQLDGIVNKNLMDNFQRETSFCKEVGFFYVAQAHIETIHNKTYSLLIKTLIRDEHEQREGLNAIAHYPSVKAVAKWAFDMMDPAIPLMERIIAFCCIEGVIFSSAFAGIYFIKRKNVLHALTKANEWISKDEALHTKFGVALYHTFTEQLEKEHCFPHVAPERVVEIIKSAVDVNKQFTEDALSVNLIGLNFPDMMTYVYCTADTLCESLGFPKIYNVHNKLDWMALIALPNKSNFFETKVSEYARSRTNENTFDIRTPC